MLQESISSHNIPYVGSSSNSTQRQHRSVEMSSPTMHTPQQMKKKISPDAHHLQQQYPSPQQQQSSFNSQQRSLHGSGGGGSSGISATGCVGSKPSANARQPMEYAGNGIKFPKELL